MRVLIFLARASHSPSPSPPLSLSLTNPLELKQTLTSGRHSQRFLAELAPAVAATALTTAPVLLQAALPAAKRLTSSAEELREEAGVIGDVLIGELRRRRDVRGGGGSGGGGGGSRGSGGGA
jgi:uncharacterized membrane protein YgcG